MLSSSPSPPSPVPFVSSTVSRSSRWDEDVPSSSTNSFEFGFPVNINFNDANLEPRETRPAVATAYPSTYTSTSSGPSPAYSARPGCSTPPQRRLNPAPVLHKSPLSSPVSFIMTATPPSPPVPVPVTRLEMKTKTTRTAELPAVGRWTKREHELFLEGLQRFGKSWKKISSLVHTRTLVQIRTHAQKYLQKQSRATIQADVKAAGFAASRESRARSKAQQRRQLGRATLSQQHATSHQVTVPRTRELSLRQWKSPRPGDRSTGFAPLAFPSSLSASVSTSSSTQPTSPRSAVQLNSVSRLDQLLQDDNSTLPILMDEYYTSPTAIEDDLLRPLYTDEQWVPRHASYANKRRRVETSASIPTATTCAVPILRPAFPSAVFEPLPVPVDLSSPSTSPSQRQSTALLLAAHETDETINYTNEWL